MLTKEFVLPLLIGLRLLLVLILDVGVIRRSWQLTLPRGSTEFFFRRGDGEDFCGILVR
jgi:hypothetical protein